MRSRNGGSLSNCDIKGGENWILCLILENDMRLNFYFLVLLLIWNCVGGWMNFSDRGLYIIAGALQICRYYVSLIRKLISTFP